MVRRRRDQAHARHRVTQLADVVRDLVAGQLAAFAGLGALRHLDLDLVGRSQVFGGHAETARRHLLDLGAQRIAVAQFQVVLDHAVAQQALEGIALLDGDAAQLVAVALLVLAAFAGVRLAADAVHRQRQRGVGFGRDRAERHGARGKAPHDFLGGLDFFQRNRLGRIDLELEQATQRHVALALVVDDVGVFLVRLVGALAVVGAHRVLQLGDRVRGPHVLFAADAEGVLSAGVQHVFQHRAVAEGVRVQAQRFLGHFEDADALDVRRRAVEVLLHQLARQADGFEDLRAGVRHVGGDAHLGHHLEQALADRLDEVLDRLLRRQVARQAAGHVGQGFHRQVRVHGFGAVAGQQREVVHFTRGAGLDHQAGGRAQALLHQVVVDGGRGQQRGNRDMLGIYAAVRHDQDVEARTHRIHGFGAQRGQAGFDAFLAPGLRVADVQLV
ncbi:hypothetical protein D9M72_289570 [compost metagenome]